MNAADRLKQLLANCKSLSISEQTNMLTETFANSREYDGANSAYICIASRNFAGRNTTESHRFLATCIAGTGAMHIHEVPPQSLSLLRFAGGIPVFVLAVIVAEFSYANCVAHYQWLHNQHLPPAMAQRLCSLADSIASNQPVRELRLKLAQAILGTYDTFTDTIKRMLDIAPAMIANERARIALAYWRKGFRPILYNQLFGLAPFNLPVLVSLAIMDINAPWPVRDFVTDHRKWQCIKVINDAWIAKYAILC